MKFRFYITDVCEGVVEGTNEEAVATHFAENEDYFVIEAETGLWLQTDGTRHKITEIASADEEG